MRRYTRPLAHSKSLVPSHALMAPGGRGGGAPWVYRAVQLFTKEGLPLIRVSGPVVFLYIRGANTYDI